MVYVNVRFVDGIAVVRPKGSMGGLYGGEETDALDHALSKLNREGVGRVVIDLGAINFLSSPALGVLVKAHKRFVERSACIVLCHLLDHIHYVFIITKLAQVFDIHDNLRQALDALRGWRAAQDVAQVAHEVTATAANHPAPSDGDQVRT